MANDRKCKFTEFERQCHRCRFFQNDFAGMSESGTCTLEACTIVTRWRKRRVWCPDFDEVPPPAPSLLRRLGKGLGLC